MYPRNAASPPPIAIGPVVQISDGAVQTSGCTVRIIPVGVAEGDGGGTTSYSTDGIVYYTPTQAETNYTAFILIAKKASCIPASVTVVTTASSTAGKVDVSHFGGTSVTGRDLGASVLLSPGTGTGQISLSSGTVTVGTNNDKTSYQLAADQAVNVTKWGGTAVASAYVQANAAQVGGQTANAAAPVTFPASIGTSTLTQTQVSGGAYDLTNATYIAALKSGLGTIPASGNWSTHDAAAVVTALGTGSTLTACVTATGFLTTLGTNAPAGWLNADAFAASALDGKGDWNTVVPDAAGTASSLLTALESHGDSTWATATGYSTHNAADVWESAARTLTAFSFSVALTDGTIATNAAAAKTAAEAVQAKLPSGGANMHAAGAAVAKSPATLNLADDTSGAFSAEALANAPTGGGTPLTAQQTRDAMKLAPTAGTPAAGSVDAHLDTIDANAETAAGGVAGSGEFRVNHDSGGTDALAFKTSGGTGIDNGVVEAYLTADYNAYHRTDAYRKGRVSTDVNGRWQSDMRLDAAAYTLLYYKQGSYGPNTQTITVASDGTVTVA